MKPSHILTGKTLLGLKIHDFCCDIQMVASDFGENSVKARVHPAISTVQADGGGMVRGIYS